MFFKNLQKKREVFFNIAMLLYKTFFCYIQSTYKLKKYASKTISFITLLLMFCCAQCNAYQATLINSSKFTLSLIQHKDITSYLCIYSWCQGHDHEKEQYIILKPDQTTLLDLKDHIENYDLYITNEHSSANLDFTRRSDVQIRFGQAGNKSVSNLYFVENDKICRLQENNNQFIITDKLISTYLWLENPRAFSNRSVFIYSKPEAKETTKDTFFLKENITETDVESLLTKNCYKPASFDGGVAYLLDYEFAKNTPIELQANTKFQYSKGKLQRLKENDIEDMQNDKIFHSGRGSICEMHRTIFDLDLAKVATKPVVAIRPADEIKQSVKKALNLETIELIQAINILLHCNEHKDSIVLLVERLIELMKLYAQQLKYSINGLVFNSKKNAEDAVSRIKLIAEAESSDKIEFKNYFNNCKKKFKDSLCVFDENEVALFHQLEDQKYDQAIKDPFNGFKNNNIKAQLEEANRRFQESAIKDFQSLNEGRTVKTTNGLDFHKEPKGQLKSANEKMLDIFFNNEGKVQKQAYYTVKKAIVHYEELYLAEQKNHATLPSFEYSSKMSAAMETEIIRLRGLYLFELAHFFVIANVFSADAFTEKSIKEKFIFCERKLKSKCTNINEDLNLFSSFYPSSSPKDLRCPVIPRLADSVGVNISGVYGMINFFIFGDDMTG